MSITMMGSKGIPVYLFREIQASKNQKETISPLCYSARDGDTLIRLVVISFSFNKDIYTHQPSPTCIGVPLNIKRCWAFNCFTARVTLDLAFFIICPSSKMQ